jgi:hypothetical protein
MIKDRGLRVTFDSHAGNEFVVHKPDGDNRTFQSSPRGLYYMDTSKMTGVTLVNTVKDNSTNYTSRDYSRALLARKVQHIIGRPSTRTFMHIVENNLLPNCPINKRDIIAAEAILGPDVGSLKGKTVRRKADAVNIKITDIPATIMSHYRDIIVGGDNMFVNKIPFFMTISRHIKFCTAEMLINQTSKTLLAAIKHVKSAYMKRGFNLKLMLMDGQFDHLRADLAGIQIELNTVSENEHVPEIERHIRTNKERTRCIYNMLPFKRMPVRMIIEMVYHSTF